ncbi:SDR family NAD(P)-dependent oxidoreductase [Actinomadura meridiana]|uniref:SDR family NAD(P)-dependent oxidoreductase n=1 Tax=Actinomadura meridiana TaxID=559626 RepID=UPI0031E8B314
MTERLDGRAAGRLDGRAVIVTGAGSVGPGWGNGRATTVVFAAEGARVLAVDRDPEALARTLDLVGENGGEAVAHECDVTDGDAVRAMVEACRASFGRVDVLVNNVGGSHPGGPAELDEQTWHAQLDANLTTAFLACKHVIPVMREQGSGAIVNVASTSGIRYTGSPQAAYAAAKAGVVQLSRVTAVQHAADGIRVNTVIPGQLHTPLVEARLAGQRADGDIEELLRQRQRRIPLGFMGDGRDTAYAALFLASDEARFITGTELIVDGGMTARCD